MTSLFNGIFKPAGTLPLASLFSQNSKFRAVQAAGQSGSEFAQAEQDKLTIAADVGSKIASKTRKASKKRKHSTVEAQETARTEKVAEPGSHTEPVTKKASTKRIASSDAQKSAAAPVTQQELPDKLAVKPKNKKHKPAADTAGNVVATTTRMPASKLPRKQNKALKAIIDDSTGQPLYSGAAIQSNGNSELAHTGDQADADTQDLADEQATLQVMKCQPITLCWILAQPNKRNLLPMLTLTRSFWKALLSLSLLSHSFAETFSRGAS